MWLHGIAWERGEGSGPLDTTYLLFYLFFSFHFQFFSISTPDPQISSSLRGWKWALSRSEDSWVGIPSPGYPPTW